MIGVEGVVAPVEEFFAESDIAPTKVWDETLKGWIFTSPDARIRILTCDLFKATAETVGADIDCIFDRGSYVAIEKEDRKTYIELMYSLYGPKTRHLMVTHEYDVSRHNGPPRWAFPPSV